MSRSRRGVGGAVDRALVALRSDQKSRWAATVAVVVVAFAAGYVLAAAVLFPEEGEAADVRLVEVPELAGLEAEGALSRLREIGLEGRVEGRIHHPEAAFGTVVAQAPLPGQLSQAGDSVELTLSAGAPSLEVPDLEGLSPVRAREVLERMGLTIETRTVPSSQPGEGVRGTEPPAGDTVRPPAEIVMLVGEGPQIVVVPDLRGRHVDDVERILDEAGLQVGAVRFEPEAPEAPGRVVAQSPPAGYSLRSGGSVSVKVAGPPGGGTRNGTEGTGV